MKTWKDQRIQKIRASAEREAAVLAGEFVRAASEEREAILAALEEEQWLARTCRELDEPL